MSQNRRPTMRINCRVVDVAPSSQTRPGIMLGSEDIEMLRFVTGRDDIVVAVMNRRRPVYEGSAMALLQRLAYLPAQDQWFLPVEVTSAVRAAPRRLGWLAAMQRLVHPGAGPQAATVRAPSPAPRIS